jgi:hypothetical protein
MATIRKSIDVPGPFTEVADAWVHFIQSVLVGHRRLACDELTCVDPTGSELVGFETIGEATTRVNLTIPVDDSEGSGAVDLVGHKASHDLIVFLDYVESGEHRREHVPDATGNAAVKEDVRRGRLTRHDARPDVESLSVRRSGRT